MYLYGIAYVDTLIRGHLTIFLYMHLSRSLRFIRNDLFT